MADAKYADRPWEYINRSQIHECGNWETEHDDSLLKIIRSGSFIFGNTYIRSQNLYWIIASPSFVVRAKNVSPSSPFSAALLPLCAVGDNALVLIFFFPSHLM